MTIFYRFILLPSGLLLLGMTAALFSVRDVDANTARYIITRDNDSYLVRVQGHIDPLRRLDMRGEVVGWAGTTLVFSETYSNSGEDFFSINPISGRREVIFVTPFGVPLGPSYVDHPRTDDWFIVSNRLPNGHQILDPMTGHVHSPPPVDAQGRATTRGRQHVSVAGNRFIYFVTGTNNETWLIVADANGHVISDALSWNVALQGTHHDWVYLTVPVGDEGLNQHLLRVNIYSGETQALDAPPQQRWQLTAVAHQPQTLLYIAGEDTVYRLGPNFDLHPLATGVRPTFSVDGNWLYIPDNNNNLVRVPLDGGLEDVQQVAEDVLAFRMPSTMPTGELVFVQDNGATQPVSYHAMQPDGSGSYQIDVDNLPRVPTTDLDANVWLTPYGLLEDDVLHLWLPSSYSADMSRVALYDAEQHRINIHNSVTMQRLESYPMPPGTDEGPMTSIQVRWFAVGLVVSAMTDHVTGTYEPATFVYEPELDHWRYAVTHLYPDTPEDAALSDPFTLPTLGVWGLFVGGFGVALGALGRRL
jgi:hypothetical protein